MKNLMTTFTAFLIVILSIVQTAQAQYVCQLGQSPILIQGSINAGDVQQSGRLSRDGQPSSCTGSTGTLENNIALRRDTHNFTNPYNEEVCVRVEQDFSGCGGNQTQSAAYSNFNPANPAANVIGDAGFSTINKGSYSFRVGPNANFSVVVNEVEQATGCPLYKLKISYLRNCRQPGFDRTNDGKADLTVYRPSAISKWWTLDSETNEVVIREFGKVGDVVTGGSDYTGDGKSDLSIYRPSETTWYYGTNQETPGANFNAQQWGLASDVRVPGDYDGDGINDVAVWRPSEGNYYILRSSNGSLQQFKWGQTNDIPVSGDFDGDNINDFAVVRQTSGGSIWWIQKSNYNFGFDEVAQWGLPTDKLVPADYDGDAITDMAVWRPSEGNFYVRRSSDSSFQSFHWGSSGDIPQPADYDGDKKMDFAVFRSGAWYIRNSQAGNITGVAWGMVGDQPATSPHRIQ